MASAIGLRLPASASCLGRHARLAGRCPSNSSLFPPLAAVVVVASHIQRKNYFYFAFGATAFAERSAAMKAPVGLLSGRAVCVSRWRGFAPTSSADFPELRNKNNPSAEHGQSASGGHFKSSRLQFRCKSSTIEAHYRIWRENLWLALPFWSARQHRTMALP